MAQVLRLPQFTSHSKEWRSKKHGSHDINPVEISLEPSDQAYRSEQWIHLVSVHRSAHVREEYVVRLSTKLVPMAWEVVFPHSAGVPRGGRASIDKTSHRPGTT